MDAHVTPDMQREAAGTIRALLQGGSTTTCVVRPRPRSHTSLLDAPRMQTRGAAHVEEPFRSRGDLRVGSRAPLARRQELSVDAPFTALILGVHEVPGPHLHACRQRRRNGCAVNRSGLGNPAANSARSRP